MKGVEGGFMSDAKKKLEAGAQNHDGREGTACGAVGRGRRSRGPRTGEELDQAGALLANKLLAALISASPPDGRMLWPRHQELQSIYGVDHDVIVRAYSTLKARGMIHRREDRIWIEAPLFGVPPDVMDLVPCEVRLSFGKDLLELYSMNVGLIVEHAVRHGTAAHRGLLQDAVDALAAGPSDQAEHLACKAIEAFTYTMGLACGNPFLVMMMTQMEALWERFGPSVFETESPAELLTLFRTFLEFAQARDAVGARRLITDAIVRTGTLALLHAAAPPTQQPPALLN